MLIDMSGPAGAEKLRSHIERYLAGEISGEIALMHIALQLGEAVSLVSTLETSYLHCPRAAGRPSCCAWRVPMPGLFLRSPAF